MLVINPAEVSLPWAIAMGGGAVLAVLLLGKLATKKSGDTKKGRKIHSLGTSIPIIGDMLEALKYADVRHDWMTAQFRRFNFEPWQINNLMGPPTVVAADPAIFEAVASTQFDTFIKGTTHQYLLKDVLGGAFVNKDGEEWYHGRKTAAKFFSAKTLRLMMTQTMKRNFGLVSKVLDARMESGKEIDLTQLFLQFSLQTFMEVGVGVDFPVIGNEKPLPFELALGDAVPITANRRLVPNFVWRLARWLNIGPEKRLKEAMDIVRTQINELIVQSLGKDPEAEKAHPDEVKVRSAIELFVEHSRADLVGLRPEDLVDFVINFVIAARDTSSLATAWFFYALSKNPGIEAKIREELAAKLPSLGVQAGDYITVDHVKQLVYLEAAIKEALRLYPTAPLMVRLCTKDTFVDEDIMIRKGQSVIVSMYAMTHNPNIWGPDASEFKPERWIDETTGTLRNFPSTKFSTFSTGPRICIGLSLAMVSLRIMIANLMHNYKFDYAENDGSYLNSIGLLMKNPLNVKVNRV